MADVRAPPPAQDEPEECLHCAIIDMVEERIAAGGADAETLASLIAESLVDLILMVPEAEQTKLVQKTAAPDQDISGPSSGLSFGQLARPATHRNTIHELALLAILPGIAHPRLSWRAPDLAGRRA
jgi:hypothetical protein